MSTLKQNIPDEMLQRMRVKGRIMGSNHINPEKNGGFFQTFVAVPSSDNYSHPTTYGVNASAPLGPDGQDVDVVCNVQPYNRRDKDGIMWCNNTLWLAVADQKDSDVPH